MALGSGISPLCGPGGTCEAEQLLCEQLPGARPVLLTRPWGLITDHCCCQHCSHVKGRQFTRPQGYESLVIWILSLSACSGGVILDVILQALRSENPC